MPRIIVFFVIGLFLTAGAAGAAELVVVASTAPGIKSGQVVASGAALDVPAGANVTLVSPAGKTVVLTGPFSGAPGGGGGGGAADTSLFSALIKLFSGRGKDTGSLGTMRAAAGSEPDDLWVVDVGRSGRFCVPAQGPITLWRSDAAKQTSLKIRNLASNQKSELPWPAGAETLDWPPDVALGDGNSYLVRLKGRRSATEIALHLVPDGLPSEPHKAVWMADKGCVKQAKRLLANLH